MARGLCRVHYTLEFRNLAKATSKAKPRAKGPTTCMSPKCDLPVKAAGYCRKHYDHVRRGLDPNDPIRVWGAGLMRRSIRLGQEVVDELLAAAEAEGISRSALMIDLIKNALDKPSTVDLTPRMDPGPALTSCVAGFPKELVERIKAEAGGLPLVTYSRLVLDDWYRRRR